MLVFKAIRRRQIQAVLKQQQNQGPSMYWQSKRHITLNAGGANKDPYWVLGVSREDEIDKIKSKYFELAKQYHPDLNPDDDKAKEAFVKIQEAYRMIQIDRNPELKLKYQREFTQYEKGEDEDEFGDDGEFSSKRPKTKGEQRREEFKQKYQSAAAGVHDDAADWNQQKFLRRYRYAHLRNTKSTVPMSIRNEDRHGLGNLQHEEVKVFDKLHVPPWLLILLFGLPITTFVATYVNNDRESTENLRKHNLKLAKKKTQKLMVEGEDESKEATELTKKTLQYSEVENQKMKEQRRIQDIKTFILADGAGQKKSYKVDIQKIINESDVQPATAQS